MYADNQPMSAKVADEQELKVQVQLDPKVNSKPKAQVQLKEKSQVQPKPKAQVQPVSKVQMHPEPNSQVQPKKKAQVQPGPKVQFQPKPKVQVHPKRKAQIQPRPKVQFQPNSKVQMDPKQKARIQLKEKASEKAQVKPEPKAQVQPEEKAQVQPEPKVQIQPQPNFHIKDVWAHNIGEEFESIEQLLPKYSYVAMNTIFPGIVARPIGDFKTTDYQYQLLRCNVSLLKIIQLGLSFFDKDGKTPPGRYSTWQFNFKFNLSEDMYAQDSIELLTNSRIQFKKHEENGIEPKAFTVHMFLNKLVLSENLKWMTFHSSFDFGYLIKIFNDELPQTESMFLRHFSFLFPCAYDIKYLLRSFKHLKGDLQEVANQLDLKRIGPQHQAGSDSLLIDISIYWAFSRRFGSRVYVLNVEVVNILDVNSISKFTTYIENTLDNGSETSGKHPAHGYMRK